MTERKPGGISWESWIDKQIREAKDRGEFDDLPGHGKPIPDIDRPRDELWWVKNKVRRENVKFTPPAIAIKVEVDRAREQIAAATSEAEVRRIAEELNEKIRATNRLAVTGPPTTLAPMDVDRVVENWQAKRQS